jgi:hypothetical protein
MEVGARAEGPMCSNKNTDFLRRIILKVQDFLIEIFGGGGVNYVSSMLTIDEDSCDAAWSAGAGDGVWLGIYCER